MTKPRSRRAPRIGAMVVLLLLLGVAWMQRETLWGLLGAGDGEPTEVSAEAAGVAEQKLQRLRSEGEPARLSEVELASLLRYRVSASQLFAMREPNVRIQGDTLRVGGMVPIDRLPSHPELDAVRGFLPDSARVEVTARLQTLDPGRVALHVDEVTLGGLPIPRRYYADLLEHLGRADEPGIPPAALPVRLPPGVGSARLEAGHLILTP